MSRTIFICIIALFLSASLVSSCGRVLHETPSTMPQGTSYATAKADSVAPITLTNNQANDDISIFLDLEFWQLAEK